MLIRRELACLILNHFVLLVISICFACCGEGNNNGDNGGKAKNVPPTNPILALVASGTTLYTTAVDYGVFRSENAGDLWERIGTTFGVSTLAISETALYSANGEIERWAGEGDSWTDIAPAPRGPHGKRSTIGVLVASGTHLYAGRYDGKLYRVEDEALWVQLNTEWANEPINTVALSGKTIYVGTVHDGIFRSTDEGVSWTQVNTGLSNANVEAIVVSGTILFAGTWKGIYRSENQGLSWTHIGLSDLFITSLAVSGTTLYAGTSKGVFRSEDRGLSWTSIGLSGSSITFLAVSGTTLCASTQRDGIFRLTDEGRSWIPINQGLEHARL